MGKIIKFDTAKLAKSKGFDYDVENFYQHHGQISSTHCQFCDMYDYDDEENNETHYIARKFNWNKLNLNEEQFQKFMWNGEVIHEFFTVCCSAPALTDVQDWLRDVHNIQIVVIPFAEDAMDENSQTLYHGIVNKKQFYGWIDDKDNDMFKTHDEALEHCLVGALYTLETVK